MDELRIIKYSGTTTSNGTYDIDLHHGNIHSSIRPRYHHHHQRSSNSWFCHAATKDKPVAGTNQMNLEMEVPSTVNPPPTQ